ncbi:MAG: hypothetical protein R3B96_03910 [Pirellulaceae bacterium]
MDEVLARAEKKPRSSLDRMAPIADRFHRSWYEATKNPGEYLLRRGFVSRVTKSARRGY